MVKTTTRGSSFGPPSGPRRTTSSRRGCAERPRPSPPQARGIRPSARVGPASFLEQDRSRWDQELISEGITLVEQTARGAEPSPYLLQACIAALHAEAPDLTATDWDEILALYRLLGIVTGHQNPTVTLNSIVAQAMVDGAEVALARIDTLEADHPGLPRIDSVRAHLLERAGRTADAAETYRRAIAATISLAEQHHLRRRLRRLSSLSASRTVSSAPPRLAHHPPERAG
ncbi:hypothetical protein [Frankia sp. AgPm24]|uniref:hypothetical protein n=1 Tax=Frankia sp. AgPm24 TaxID=631128 RepID=UPI00200C54E1|nr:hypothetical protein [Frankia sp. AgPm24]